MVRHHVQQRFSKARVYKFSKDTVGEASFIIRLDIHTLKVDQTSHQIVRNGRWTFCDGKQEFFYHSSFTFCESFKDRETQSHEFVAKIKQIVFHLRDVIVARGWR
jgi:hypothetical protein